MPDQPPSTSTLNALCKSCDYPLRGLPSNRCPKCGRPFDPNDPGTMNLRRPVGYWGRKILRPMTWPMCVLLLAVLVGLIWVTSLSGLTWRASTVDVRYYLRWQSVEALKHLNRYERTYTLTLSAVTFAVLLLTLRAAARAVVVIRSRQPLRMAVPRASRWSWAAVALLAVCAAIILLGWRSRVALIVAEEELTPVPRGSIRLHYPCLSTVSSDQQSGVIETAVLHLRNPRHRTAGIKILVENLPDHAKPILLSALASEKDVRVRVTLLHLLSLARDPELLPQFLKHADDPDPHVRAAAIDAIGIFHKPAYDIRIGMGPDNLVDSDPQIVVAWFFVSSWPSSLRDKGSSGVSTANDEKKVSGSVRDIVLRRMTASPHPIEREAAARALLEWPPDGYRLRVAEWGVWVGGTDDSLKMQQSLLDEIPPFVHRTGNPIKDFANRLETQISINKPILHITSSHAMSLDLGVMIHLGRPYFVYPRPDDFRFRAQMETFRANLNQRTRTIIPWSAPTATLLAPLDSSNIPALPKLRKGYPWRDQGHDSVGDVMGSIGEIGNDLVAGGICWQSLIVSPQKLPWMALPAVPNDPRFKWWERLREVDCSWVSNRSESERFLYYDGPTLARTPISTVLRNGILHSTRNNLQKDFYDLGFSNTNDRTRANPPADYHRRRGFFIRVAGSHAAGFAIDDFDPQAGIDISRQTLHQGDSLISEFLTALIRSGLTESEAAGLADAWRKQFFQTDGTRFLLIMSQCDYDYLCPLQIRPHPTELVRVGIILTEFPK